MKGFLLLGLCAVAIAGCKTVPVYGDKSCSRIVNARAANVAASAAASALLADPNAPTSVKAGAQATITAANVAIAGLDAGYPQCFAPAGN